ncbi:Predicted transcriptional regulators [Paenibacillus uliginis N3/975]|uniref:Predicted transcriptional regulators n=1 Tax=Paenibacillus uliginis N3/975 TaxID=1313296 RepID=A0A1X7HIY4_9BACL|nr:MerR family transcriptional regulator [Paenibacillus uliginis]SMF86556.1 Predicted transcriptional regulators [Paenibacillus uliginis N3/975]
MAFVFSPYLTAPYEQIGLITPAKKEDSAYRAYDVEVITRLRQIIVLRKPLKQIAEVLQSAKAQKSPYFLQHAHNPVNWFLCSEDALKSPNAKTSLSSFLLGTASY